MSLITKPNTFSAGATIVASEHNDNFNTIYNDYNGNITNVNASASAAFDVSKIDFATMDADISATRSNTTSDAWSITCNSMTSGSALVVVSTGTLTDGLAKFTADSATSADVIQISVDGITTGKGISLTSTSTAKTSDNLFHVTHIGNSAGANTGNLAYFEMNDSDTGTRNVVEIVQEHASATGSTALSVRQDSTQRTILVDQNGNGIGIEIDTEATTGQAIKITNPVHTTTAGIIMIDSADALTSGRMLNLISNSPDATARELVKITNDHTSAVGVTPFVIVQDAPTSTNFKKIMAIGGFTIYVSDGTTADGALTGVVGDLCLNGGTGNGQLAYCDVNGTNWTDM